MTWTPEKAAALSALVGRPWANGADGPNEFGCWGLVRHVSREFYDRELPEIAHDAENDRACIKTIAQEVDNRRRWLPVDVPEDGCAVVMGNGRVGRHVGIYVLVDRGFILHSEKGSGVIATPVINLAWTGGARFYRFVGDGE